MGKKNNERGLHTELRRGKWNAEKRDDREEGYGVPVSEKQEGKLPINSSLEERQRGPAAGTEKKEKKIGLEGSDIGGERIRSASVGGKIWEKRNQNGKRTRTGGKRGKKSRLVPVTRARGPPYFCHEGMKGTGGW